MKERPILFSGAMVRALLNGSKTQTRRVVKPAPMMMTDRRTESWAGQPSALMRLLKQSGKCYPYGQPGDRLWVRETFAHGIHAMAAKRDEDGPFVYAATDQPQARLQDKWKPSIFMPRCASRLTLEITRVRVEQLQDISEADAMAEGCTKNHNGYFWGGPLKAGGLKQMATATDAYRTLWESINGAGSWDLNPWCWCVEFRRITE